MLVSSVSREHVAYSIEPQAGIGAFAVSEKNEELKTWLTKP